MITKGNPELIDIDKIPCLLSQENISNKIKVSVIIPAYNVEKYISECVKSVLDNTLKEIEVICINDGSTDNTLQILNEIAKKEERLKVYSQKNQGLGATRNFGLSIAKGEYVYFIDGDDFIHNRAFEYLYYEAEKNELDMIMFSAITFYENETLKKKFLKSYTRKNDYSNITDGKKLFTTFCENKEFKASSCLYLLKRSFVEKNKLEFNKKIIHEDEIFTVKCMALTNRVIYKNIDLYYRRIRENSITTKKNLIKIIKARYYILKELMNFSKKYNLKKYESYYKALRIRCIKIVLPISLKKIIKKIIKK